MMSSQTKSSSNDEVEIVLYDSSDDCIIIDVESEDERTEEGAICISDSSDDEYLPTTSICNSQQNPVGTSEGRILYIYDYI